MKKITLIIILLIATISLTSCNDSLGLSTSSEPEVTSVIITLKEAEEIALSHSNKEKDSFILKSSQLKTLSEQSQEYNLIFTDKTHRYEYNIDAVDGAIISFTSTLLSQESTENSSSSQRSATGEITIDEAKEIAEKHAKVEGSEVTYTKEKTDYYNGNKKYELEFYLNNIEYEYDISITGEILSYDFDTEDHNITNTPGKGDIGIEKAKSIALAQVSGATNGNIEIEADTEDGRKIYEGEIKYNNIEYDFEIDASTGNIIEWKIDD